MLLGRLWFLVNRSTSLLLLLLLLFKDFFNFKGVLNNGFGISALCPRINVYILKQRNVKN